MTVVAILGDLFHLVIDTVGLLTMAAIIVWIVATVCGWWQKRRHQQKLARLEAELAAKMRRLRRTTRETAKVLADERAAAERCLARVASHGSGGSAHRPKR